MRSALFFVTIQYIQKTDIIFQILSYSFRLYLHERKSQYDNVRISKDGGGFPCFVGRAFYTVHLRCDEVGCGMVIHRNADYNRVFYKEGDGIDGRKE